MSEWAQTPEAILRRLEWTVLRRLDGLLYGDYRTLFRGFGVDLADLREYQYHDDVRHIDWNVTARLQTPYVRVYNEERELTAWFLLDLSPSVDFGSQKIKKRAVATELVAVLARAFSRHGNRIGHGAGYYDMTINRLRSMKSVVAVGIAYAVQEVPQVPVTERDARLDLVLTERGVLDFRKG